MFKKLTDWADRMAHSKHTRWGLFVFCVLESVIIPVPPDLLLIGLALARPKQAIHFATIAAVGSVTGGLIGYAVGRFAFEPLAVPALNWLCTFDARACADVFLPKVQKLFDEHGLWVIGVSAMSPVVPYRLTILAAGLGHMAVVPFTLVSLAVHWARYALVSWLVAHYGRKAVHLAQDHLPWAFGILGALALVVYIVWVYF